MEFKKLNIFKILADFQLTFINFNFRILKQFFFKF